MNFMDSAPVRALAGVLILGAVLFLAPSAAAQEPPSQDEDDAFGAVLERDELLAAVLLRNPSIAAARSAWQAARQRIPQDTSLDDPMARLGTAPLSHVSSDTRLGLQAGLSQRFPFPGSLELRGEIAEGRAAAAGERIEQVRLRLATTASLLFDRYYLVARELEVNAEHLRLLEDFQRVAVSRYGTGLAPQQAPIQAEVEAAHLMQRDIVLGTRRRTLAAQINALLHRNPRAPLPPAPRQLEPPSAPPAVSGDLFVAALTLRPEIRAQEAEIAARRAAIALEKLDFYPDFEVSTSYNSMWAMPEHRWMVGVMVNVPIRRQRIRAAVAEAEARLAAESSELARLEDAVREEAEVALLEFDEAGQVLHLYTNRVLPAARDQIAAARSGFETGSNSMLALIDAERTLRSAELEYHQAVADAFSRRAELDLALGRLPLHHPDDEVILDPDPATAEEQR